MKNNEFFRGKTLLLTGSSGLIGSHLLEHFLSMNDAGYDMKLLVTSQSSPSEYIRDLANQNKVRNRVIDLTDFDDYENIPRADIIIHAAGYAQPKLFMANPIDTLTVNTVGTLALLKALKPKGSFVFLSSSEVYCGNTSEPCKEDICGTTTPYHTRASYIEGKRSAEAACAAYYKDGKRAISIRLGDIYGPGTRKHDQRALNSFIEKALTTGKICLQDQGQAMRTYCYVSDAVESIIDILTSGEHQVYNVGGPIFTSIRELAILIGNITNTEVYFPLPENNDKVSGAPAFLNLDMSRLQNEFGKIKYVSLADGLKKTIEFQKTLYLTENAK